MKNLNLIFLFIVLSVFTSYAQSKSDKIKQLLELTGSAKLGVQLGNTMLESFKGAYKDVDQKFWDEFMKEFNTETLTELIIPIYDKYYSEEDVDQLIEFYNTPVGKKVIETLPKISQESMEVGQAWGKAMAEKVYERLKEEGYAK